MKNKFKKIGKLIRYTFFSYIVAASSAHAENTNIKFDNPIGDGKGNIYTIIDAILDLFIKVGTVLAVVMIVYTGLKFVMARGNPKEIETAKSMLLWTCVGTILIIGARVVKEVVCNTAVELGASACK